MGNPSRDALLRETFRLNREIGYVGFRHRFFTDPDAIKEWPDPAMRERELRRFWDNKADFASYHRDFADLDVDVLTTYRDWLRGIRSAGEDSQITYYEQACGEGRRSRLETEGLGDARPAGIPVPSPEDIWDERDGLPRPEEWRRLRAELTHDYGLRHLEDRGVKYEDVVERELDHAAARGHSERGAGEQREKRRASPGAIAEGQDAPEPRVRGTVREHKR
jgi:hypothetical protein